MKNQFRIEFKVGFLCLEDWSGKWLSCTWLDWMDKVMFKEWNILQMSKGHLKGLLDKHYLYSSNKPHFINYLRVDSKHLNSYLGIVKCKWQRL